MEEVPNHEIKVFESFNNTIAWRLYVDNKLFDGSYNYKAMCITEKQAYMRANESLAKLKGK